MNKRIRILLILLGVLVVAGAGVALINQRTGLFGAAGVIQCHTEGYSFDANCRHATSRIRIVWGEIEGHMYVDGVEVASVHDNIGRGRSQWYQMDADYDETVPHAVHVVWIYKDINGNVRPQHSHDETKTTEPCAAPTPTPVPPTPTPIPPTPTPVPPTPTPIPPTPTPIPPTPTPRGPSPRLNISHVSCADAATASIEVHFVLVHAPDASDYGAVSYQMDTPCGPRSGVAGFTGVTGNTAHYYDHFNCGDGVYTVNSASVTVDGTTYDLANPGSTYEIHGCQAEEPTPPPIVTLTPTPVPPTQTPTPVPVTPAIVLPTPTPVPPTPVPPTPVPPTPTTPPEETPPAPPPEETPTTTPPPEETPVGPSETTPTPTPAPSTPSTPSTPVGPSEVTPTEEAPSTTPPAEPILPETGGLSTPLYLGIGLMIAGAMLYLLGGRKRTA